MATIITFSMANASSTSSVTIAVAAMTSATTRRVFPSTKTRASSPDAYMASTSITRTMSAALNWCNQACIYYNKRKQQQKNTAAMTRAPCVTHVTIAGQAAKRVAWQSQ
jgi:hypothetical protein